MGRKLNDNLRAGTPLHTYLPGPHSGVWNEEALQASKEIILCESIIDALTFWCAGFRNETESYGMNGLTEDHQAAFARHDPIQWHCEPAARILAPAFPVFPLAAHPSAPITRSTTAYLLAANPDQGVRGSVATWPTRASAR